jgi:hypothetical protein
MGGRPRRGHPRGFLRSIYYLSPTPRSHWPRNIILNFPCIPHAAKAEFFGWLETAPGPAAMAPWYLKSPMLLGPTGSQKAAGPLAGAAAAAPREAPGPSCRRRPLLSRPLRRVTLSRCSTGSEDGVLVRADAAAVPKPPPPASAAAPLCRRARPQVAQLRLVLFGIATAGLQLTAALNAQAASLLADRWGHTWRAGSLGGPVARCCHRGRTPRRSPAPTAAARSRARRRPGAAHMTPPPWPQPVGTRPGV